MNSKYTVLVNSSDGFEDCWDPFFRLFHKYWPTFNGEIFLNTELKKYSFQGLNIKNTCVSSANPSIRMTWSECLILALNQISTPLVLYFQEDYFLDRKVDYETILMAVEHMIANPKIGHVSLTRHGSFPPYEEYDENWAEKISQNAKYRISTQAGLWRVDILLSYLKARESGWMFEIYGTWRAQKRNDLFLKLKFTDLPPINYLHTGIIKGQWHPGIIKIFEKNNINIDYTLRGFYIKKKTIIHQKLELYYKLMDDPVYFFYNFLRYLIF